MFTILIPTLNNLPYLKICINSIIKTSYKENEILVHVNEDTDHDIRDFLNDKKIKFTYTSKNIGLCSAINIIAKKANFSYLIYAHDDMYFCPNWEKALVDEINKINHNSFYISGSMIEPNSGHIQFNCGESIDEFNENKLLKNLNNLQIKDHQGSHFAPHCVHKKTWDSVGGFSEEFNPGIGSDPDFNMKLWKIGCRIFKGLNDFKVYHFGSLTTRKNKNVKQNRGDNTFLLKWGISTYFFKKYYLRSRTLYNGPLKDPEKNFKYYVELFKCKIVFCFQLILKKLNK
tara:strand:- start:192 stop:1052 length:861 start_codon:yes stop_codon:yes gene_type:complete